MCKRALIAVVFMGGMAALLVGAVLVGTAANPGLGLGMMAGGLISGFMTLSVLSDLEEFEKE